MSRVMDYSVSSGVVRTFFVFLDLPTHVEYRVPDMPILPEGTHIDVEMDVRYPRDPRKTRSLDGPYVVHRRRLIFTTKRPDAMGLSQYLELQPVVNHSKG